MDSFLKPLPVDIEGRPDRTILCDSDTKASCFLWDAGDVQEGLASGGGTYNPQGLLLQAPNAYADGVDTDPPFDAAELQLGTAADERRVVYSQFYEGGNRKLFTYPATNSQKYDLWNGMGIPYIVGNTASETAADERANAVITEVLLEKEGDIPDPTDNTRTIPVTYLLGDIFHADPLVFNKPANFTYYTSDPYLNKPLCGAAADPDRSPPPRTSGSPTATSAGARCSSPRRTTASCTPSTPASSAIGVRQRRVPAAGEGPRRRWCGRNRRVRRRHRGLRRTTMRRIRHRACPRRRLRQRQRQRGLLLHSAGDAQAGADPGGGARSQQGPLGHRRQPAGRRRLHRSAGLRERFDRPASTASGGRCFSAATARAGRATTRSTSPSPTRSTTRTCRSRPPATPPRASTATPTAATGPTRRCSGSSRTSRACRSRPASSSTCSSTKT